MTTKVLKYGRVNDFILLNQLTEFLTLHIKEKVKHRCVYTQMPPAGIPDTFYCLYYNANMIGHYSISKERKLQKVVINNCELFDNEYYKELHHFIGWESPSLS